MKGSSVCLFLLTGAQASILDLISRTATTCKQYTVKADDTCLSIGRKNVVTYAQLLSWNQKINPACSNLGELEGTKICISNPLGNFAIPSNTHGTTTVVTTRAPIPTPTPDKTNSYCGKYYKVAKGDDCSDLTAQSGITLKDLRAISTWNRLFLNPEVWENCTNLLTDYNYCVQPVGQITTYPGYGGSKTSRPFKPSNFTSVPYSDALSKYSSTEPVIPIANGTRLDCYSYFWLPNVTENAAADCWALAMVHEVSPEDFILWNPSLAENDESMNALCGCGGSKTTTSITPSSTISTSNTTTTRSTTATPGNKYAYPCTLAASSSYCVELSAPTEGSESKEPVAPPSPRAEAEIANCTWWHAPQGRQTCKGMAIVWHFTVAEFFAMNPSVGEDCSKLVLGTYYCLSTYADGFPAGIPDWKPSTTATGSITATRTSGSESTKTATGTGIPTPSPVQTGMVKTCKSFYKVVKGDSCYDIAKDHQVSLKNFYLWNPAVKTDCSGLQSNEYVCIGIGSTESVTSTSKVVPTSKAVTSKTGNKSTTQKPTTTTGFFTPSPIQTGMTKSCKSFYKVAKSDTCYDIASDHKIALKDFYSWNPATKSDCSGLQAKVYVCVGIKTASAKTTSG
ncbi:Fc.00g001630.m01.CDS01 [Cosmosporella sp. VM-42]